MWTPSLVQSNGPLQRGAVCLARRRSGSSRVVRDGCLPHGVAFGQVSVSFVLRKPLLCGRQASLCGAVLPGTSNSDAEMCIDAQPTAMSGAVSAFEQDDHASGSRSKEFRFDFFEVVGHSMPEEVMHRLGVRGLRAPARNRRTTKAFRPIESVCDERLALRMCEAMSRRDIKCLARKWVRGQGVLRCGLGRRRSFSSRPAAAQMRSGKGSAIPPAAYRGISTSIDVAGEISQCWRSPWTQ